MVIKSQKVAFIRVLLAKDGFFLSNYIWWNLSFYSMVPDALILGLIFISLYISIFYFFVFFEHYFSIFKSPLKPTTYYSTTIIVPAYNEKDTIVKTILSLQRLHYPKDKLKIMVIDDGSTDGTYDVVRKRFKQSVLLYKKENGENYTRLNFGLWKQIHNW